MPPLPFIPFPSYQLTLQIGPERSRGAPWVRRSEPSTARTNLVGADGEGKGIRSLLPAGDPLETRKSLISNLRIRELWNTYLRPETADAVLSEDNPEGGVALARVPR